MIETLTHTKAIRARIESIFAKSSGRRVALVAFIGGDVHKFVKEPQGLEVYCWPNVVATNPDGLRWLINNHATVHFVNNLHMKLYWSEKAGYLIGSCNLSSNALDDAMVGLHEVAIWNSESSGLDIKALVKRLHNVGATLVTRKVLQAFEARYDPPTRRSDGSAKPAAVATHADDFDKYLAAVAPTPFRYISWSKFGQYKRATVAAARETIEKETGSPARSSAFPIRDGIAVSTAARSREWILCVRERSDGTVGKLAWLYPHVIVKEPKDDQALQLRTLHVPNQPFAVDSDNFHKRFARYVQSKRGTASDLDKRFSVNAFKKFESKPLR